MTETTASLLPYLGVLKVSGDDRASFLHNQLSNDINNLPASHACYATYNTPKGRVMANMLVLNTGDELWLIMSADLIDAIAKRLRMFVMRSKAVLENVSDRLGVASSLIPTNLTVQRTMMISVPPRARPSHPPGCCCAYGALPTPIAGSCSAASC